MANSNWTVHQKEATKIVVKDNCYVEYYTAATRVIKGYAGRLDPKTVAYVKYDETRDAMKIMACPKKKKAEGKYIMSPKNSKGKTTLSLSEFVKTTTEAKTTTDPNTGKTTPENTTETTTTTEDGEEVVETETSGSDTSSTAEAIIIDDFFTDRIVDKIYQNSTDYYNNLQNGLRVKDLRGILGMPHQFLPLTDPRIDSENGIGGEENFGRVYSEKIIKQIPLLLMTPGIPTFMAGYGSEQKEKILGKLVGLTEESFDTIFTDGRVGKYYSLKYAYTEYFHYVNAMLRSAAWFLEINGETIDGKELGSLNWLYATANIGDDNVLSASENGGLWSHEGLADFLGPYTGSIAFYADAGTTVDDSFGNATTESQLASGLNNLSDQAREILFIGGNVGAVTGLNDTLGLSSVETAARDIMGKVNEFIGTGNALSNILSKATTILAGGRLVFPEIWSDSSFSRSYSCSMKLVSPSGDKLSVYLNILVPIYHLLGFMLPRESTDDKGLVVTQAYFSPFLVRAYYKGLFNVDMGIIPGMTITKGDEGEWTVDGIPTVANVSFEIKDLYDGMYMSKQTANDHSGIMSNIQELDYIANSCGINVNDQEVIRTTLMYAALGFTSVTDRVTIDIFGKIGQYFNQKIQNIFGKF